MVLSYLIAKSLAVTNDMLQVSLFVTIIQEHNATMYNF